jgi:hypothetical protein
MPESTVKTTESPPRIRRSDEAAERTDLKQRLEDPEGRDEERSFPGEEPTHQCVGHPHGPALDGGPALGLVPGQRRGAALIERLATPLSL